MFHHHTHTQMCLSHVWRRAQFKLMVMSTYTAPDARFQSPRASQGLERISNVMCSADADDFWSRTPSFIHSHSEMRCGGAATCGLCARIKRHQICKSLRRVPGRPDCVCMLSSMRKSRLSGNAKSSGGFSERRVSVYSIF